ncbi:MAG TPA: hypothetical protein DDZ67_14760 [Xanthomonadaceae bacterium]|nr:hypothetical protein [Xanthomonadaceae bacterium]
MPQRPTSVTVVASLLIALAVISLPMLALSALMPNARQIMELNALPVPLQLAMGIGGIAIQIVVGVAALKGRNWGRWLYVVWQASMLVVQLFTSPMKLMLIPGALFFAVFAFFLFTGSANRWFQPAPALPAAADA